MKHVVKQQLEELLTKLSTDNSLTSDALGKYKDALDAVEYIESEKETLVNAVEDLKKALHGKDQKINSLEHDIVTFKNEKVDVESRAEKVKQREDKMTKLELEASHAKERVADHKEMFSLVFRNTELHKEIMVNRNTYNNGSSVSDNENNSEKITQK